jgi:hypothetical protein
MRSVEIGQAQPVEKQFQMEFNRRAETSPHLNNAIGKMLMAKTENHQI